MSAIVGHRFNAQSSVLLTIIYVANALALVSFGNARTTTFVLRFTSSNSRSSMSIVRIRA